MRAFHLRAWRLVVLLLAGAGFISGSMRPDRPANGPAPSTMVQSPCLTICFHSPQYWLLNLNRLPGGTVLIGGVNFNSPISTNDVNKISLALQGGPSGAARLNPLQQLNREFTAAQLNLNAAGGGASAGVVNALWSRLSCYGLFFAPAPLGAEPPGAADIFTLTPDSALNDLFEQARLAIQDNRTMDMPALTSLFDQLNGNDPLDRCQQGGAGRPQIFNGPLVFNTPLENPTQPACGCGNESTYNQGVSLVAQECSKCELAAWFPGIAQDTGKMVFLHNGEFFRHEVDLEIPGRGFDWKFERKYRSGITFEGPLGHNWEFNYNRRLFVEATGAVLRLDGQARADRYLPAGSSFQAPLGFYTQLKRNPDGSFVERDRSGTRVFYAAPDALGIARMTELRDRNGNRMRFEYNALGQLVRVIETLGRPIVYRYNAQRRLSEIEDFGGRKLKFGYDAQGDLVSVTSPAVTGTPNGNDFPAGKTTRYRYSAGLSDPRLNHNLIEITAPNEVAAGGPPRVIVEYQTDPAQPGLDRALRQTIGGVNANGVPAGGAISYEYSELGVKRKPGMAPPDENTSVFQTTVTDRNGNLTEYRFNPLGNIVRTREFTNRGIRAGDPEFFETRYEYNREGELTRIIKPAGNVIEYVYDQQNPDRFQQGNLLSETSLPDPARGGDQAFIRVTRNYEPIYNQARAVTEARGNDPSYLPQNGGPNSPERYTTTHTFDYQEGTDFAMLAGELGVSVAEVMQRLNRAGAQLGMGDVNGDGLIDQAAGNVVETTHPTVTLLPGSNTARIEGGASQPVSESYAYNRFGQIVSHRDEESNVTLRRYHPENDPDGDGQNHTPGAGAEAVGYLKEEIRDAASSSERNSKTNPAPAAIRLQLFYDAVGNVTREIDGRGIETRYVVNQLNQVAQVIRAAGVSQARANPEEPDWNGCGDQTLPECSQGMIAFAYLTDIFYDHNDNVIRREVENRDSNNQSLAGNFIDYSFAYDILDRLLEERQEASEDPPVTLVKGFRYDRNENSALEISPLAVAGAQPSNVVSYIYDERDLLFTSTRGGMTGQFKSLGANFGVPEINQIQNSPDISTFTRGYDPNHNLTSFIDGADNDGDGRPEATVYQYDGFDRRARVTDAVGNQEAIDYDPVGKVVRLSRFGQVGGAGASNQTLLSQVERKYDELSRMFERNDRLFVYQDASYARPPILQDGPLGRANDGWVTTRYEYDRKSRQVFFIEDDLSAQRTFYDGVDRRARLLDPEENEVIYTYDDNDNIVRTVEVEITARAAARAGQAPDLRETFTTINVYDALNRLIRATDNLGQTSRKHYDSRDNLLLTSDAQHSQAPGDLIADPLGLFPAPGQTSRGASKVNRPGNTMGYFHDGVNRKIAEARHLRVNGQGKNPLDTSNPANPDGLIVSDYAWDANSNLAATADDGSAPGDQNTSIGLIEPVNPKGNVTLYLYDDLNRCKREVFDDGTINGFTYDADNNLAFLVDENGSTTRNTFDGINRLARKDIARASQVVGATRQEFEYDGLSRLTRSFDNNDPADARDDATVIYAFDSLGRLLEEAQNGRAISSRWQGDDNRVGLVYPNGRVRETAFDKLDRITALKDGGSSRELVSYSYIGPARVLERAYENGVRLTMLDNQRQSQTGYDGLRRLTQLRHLGANNALVVGFAHTYDRADNKLTEEKLHDPANSELYPYDSAYRLTDFQRGALSAGKEAIVKPTSNAIQRQQWTLDGVGNWPEVQLTVGGAVITETRRHSSMNELLTRTINTGPARQLLFDENGNETDDGVFTFQWDYKNRLRTVTRKADGLLVAAYSYDAADRRIRKVVTNSGPFNGVTAFYLDGWQEIEERDDTDAVKQQYIYGVYIDEPLVLDRNLDGGGATGGGDQRLFYHQNTSFSVFALTDDTGRLVESYQYDAYGRGTVFLPGPGGTVGGGRAGVSAVGNPYLFTGRRLDAETGLGYYRRRFLNSEQGRFLSRDPVADKPGSYAASAGASPALESRNRYEYTASNPLKYNDPEGLWYWLVSWTEWGTPCSVDQWGKIGAARTEAKEMTRASLNYLNDNLYWIATEDEMTWSGFAPYKSWFGKFDSGRYTKVKDNFGKIDDALGNRKISFLCRGCWYSSALAYVYSGGALEIFLCPGFFSSPATGFNSRAAILVHELSHEVAGTGDGKNKPADASKCPKDAVKNAYNHEFFAADVRLNAP